MKAVEMPGSESQGTTEPHTCINSPGGTCVQNLFLNVLRNRDCPLRREGFPAGVQHNALRVNQEFGQAGCSPRSFELFLPVTRVDTAVMSNNYPANQ